MSSIQNQKINTNYFQTLANNYKSTLNSDEVVDVITFATANWGLDFRLFPVQRFILKCIYGMQLDQHSKDIPVPDLLNSKQIGVYTESDFMKFLIDERKTNLTSYQPGVNRRQLILSLGRRSSKCQSVETQIYTTKGIVTVGQLFDRFNKGQDIGIYTFKEGEIVETFNIKMEENGIRDCLRVVTSKGKSEQTTLNHPYLVWNDDMIQPQWVEAKDLKIGDLLACSRKIGGFGDESIGINKAKIIGYLYGDGGISQKIVSFTNSDSIVINDFRNVIEKQFPECSLFKVKHKYEYSVRKKQKNNFVKNPVKEWLIQNNLDGKLAKQKYIPDIIKKAPKEQVSAFLNALFACDGFVAFTPKRKDHPQYYCIKIALASKKFIYDIQRILLNYGISSNIKKRKVKNTTTGKFYDAWYLSIQDTKSIVIFCKQIGILGKEDKVRNCLKNNLNRESKLLAPEGVWNRIIKYQKENNKHLSDIYGIHGVTNKRLRRYKSLSIRKVLQCADNMNDEIIKKYCNGSISWEKIQQIQEVGKHKTIAIQVSDTHVIANEIITHNSVMASIIANYETYKLVKTGNPQQYFGFPPGQEIAVTTVATTEQQASTLFQMIKARGVNCSFLKDRIANKTQTYFNLKTDWDVEKDSSPSIKLLCGGSSSASLRGKNNLVVIFDEAAFFQQGVKNSGQDIYNALTPSIASFTKDGKGMGKIMLLSSPFTKSGLFYNKFVQSFSDEQSMLMFQMYTAMVNPTVDSAFLRSEFRKNKESFMCEFGAEFSDTITSWIDEQSLRKSIVNPNIIMNKQQGQRGKNYYMGIDYGGKTDGTSYAIVHKQGDQIILDSADVYYGGNSDVWDISNSLYLNTPRDFVGFQVLPINGIADKIKELCDRFYIVDGWFDQFNGYGLLQALKERKLSQFRMQPMSASLNTQMFQLSKILINSGFVKLFNHPVLIPELLTLEESKNGGQLSVEAPRRVGFHDDISDAFCRAVWSCYNDTSKQKMNGSSLGIGNGNFGNRSYQSYQMRKMRMHDGFYNKRTNLNF